jgi:hypothetical protein
MRTAHFIRLRRRPRACPWMNAKIKLIATARCHPRNKADNRGVAEGEDGFFIGTTGLSVGIHFGFPYQSYAAVIDRICAAIQSKTQAMGGNDPPFKVAVNDVRGLC